jgi:Helicase associated domain
MDAARRQRLEALPGWSWDPFSDQWEKGYSHLKHFSEREGHCWVPEDYKTDDGYPLGFWVHNQRHKAMDALRRQRLEALRCWSWDRNSEKWEEGYSCLKQFAEREGHCRVPHGYKTDDGYRLGAWVANQRTTEGKMEPNRRERLEALPGWSWDVSSDLWEESFSRLKQFSNREGHCRVLQRYKTKDGYRLGAWVAKQRNTKDTMDPDHRQRLETLPGWSWDRNLEKWEEGYSHLKMYSDREGHCRVPRD